MRGPCAARRKHAVPHEGQAGLWDLAPPPVPSLWDYRYVVISSSGGKDSSAAEDEAVRIADEQGYPRDRIVVVFADLGDEDEWPGVRELAAEQAARYGLRFEVVHREVDDGDGGLRPQGLLEFIVSRWQMMWPSASARFCTAGAKRGPIYKLLTRLVAEAEAAGWDVSRAGPVRILNVMGLRAQESPARRKMRPFSHNAQASGKGRPAKGNRKAAPPRRLVDEWLPVHHWTTKQVWQRITEKGIPYHPVYHLGMPRLSCMFCVLASRAALVLAARLNPEGAHKRLRAEQLMAHRRLVTSTAFALNRLAEVPLSRLEWTFYRGINQGGWKFQPGLSMAAIIAEAHQLGPIGATVDAWRANVPRHMWVEDLEAAAEVEDWAA